MVRFAVSALTVTLAALSCVSANLDNDHPVRFMKRGAKSKYPAALVTPPDSSLPQEWMTALNTAVSAGKIPDIPVSTETASGNVVYPSNKVGNSQETCSWTISKCNGPDDITDAPDGEWTIAFDDGPTAASPSLYKFLQKNNQRGTHFMIGSQILAYPDVFQQAIDTDQEIALHTWSHSLLTTKNNTGVVAELGWNMQIIYDMSGRVPKLYRPPQGDVDSRVRAIAKEVFGLTAVMWNAECNDWCLEANGQSDCPGQVPGKNRATIASAIQQALDRPKSPGVSILEHELNSLTVGLFTDYYPNLATKGWKPQAVSDHYNTTWYTNAKDNTDTPTNVTSLVYSTTSLASQNSTSSSSSAAQGSSSSNSQQPSSLGDTKQSSTAFTSNGCLSSTSTTSLLLASLPISLAALYLTI